MLVTILYAVLSPTVSNIWKGPLGAPVPLVHAISMLLRIEQLPAAYRSSPLRRVEPA